MALLTVLVITNESVDFFKDNIEDDIKSALEKQSIYSKNIEYKFPSSIQINEVAAFIPAGQIRIPLFVDKIKGKTPLTSLLLLSPTLESTAKAYGGKLKLQAKYPLLNRILQLNLNANSLQLNKHPLPKAFQVSGLLTLELRARLAELQKQNKKVENADLELKLTDASYPGGYKISGLFEVPAINNLMLEVKAKDRNQVTYFKQIELNSSLGSLTGEGVLRRNSRNLLTDGTFKANIKLSNYGLEKLGGYLALGANVSPDLATKNWQLKLRLRSGKIERLAVEQL